MFCIAQLNGFCLKIKNSFDRLNYYSSELANVLELEAQYNLFMKHF